MEKLSLGNTLEEKKQTYAVLTKKSKKWGKVFAIFGVIMALFFASVLITGAENIIIGLLASLAMFVAAPLGYYWYGQIVFYGYLVMCAFFSEKNIDGAAVAGAVGTSVLVSYVLGGKKAVKKLGIFWVVILLASLTIGILVGFHYYLRFRKEAKKLGLKNNVQSADVISYNYKAEKEKENIMFCSNCGKKLADGSVFCSSCGTKANGAKNNNQSEQSNQNPTNTVNVPSHHEIPKCNYCGNIEEWNVGPLFRPLDYVLGVVLLLLGFFPGLAYLGVVGVIRSNKNNREKICKKCGAKNMFTNMY